MRYAIVGVVIKILLYFSSVISLQIAASTCKSLYMCELIISGYIYVDVIVDLASATEFN